MRWIYKLPLRLRSLFGGNRVEHELNDELRFHLEKLINEKASEGMGAEEARYAALREMGGEDQIKEECRDMRRVNYIENFMQDVRYGLRQLRRNPGFTAVAVLSLAVGIGATTAIFSVIDAVMLHHPPYQNPTQLVEISSKNPEHEDYPVSAGDFSDWQSATTAFRNLAAYQAWDFRTLTGAGDPDEVWASPVSTNLFHLLGINAMIGRTFGANETNSLILSHEYWRAHFASDPGVIGKALDLDGQPYTVIGIAPADFEFPGPNAQVWIPLTLSAADKNDHADHLLHVIARLKAGYTPKHAQAEMDTVARRLAMQYPKTNAGWSASVEPFKIQGIQGTLRTALLALMGSVVFVLMIVCANVASMLLARGVARQGEIAIRAALGAGRSRLIRQLLVESLMLAGMASVAGLGLGFLALQGVVSLVPKYSLVEPGLHEIAINLRVLAFTMAISPLTGIVSGLLPALRISGRNLDEWLKQRGRIGGTITQKRGLQRALVVSEVALALVLLAGAGLLIRSFQSLSTAPTGFNPDHLLTVRVPLAKYKYSAGPQSVEFYREVLDRIKAIPGVKSVAMANNLPFTGFHTTLVFNVPGKSPGSPEATDYVAGRSISPGYFQTMGIPLLAGRDFTPADSERDAGCVRMINDAFARRYWPGENAVGKQLYGACPKGSPALIVGVVADSKQDSVDSKVHPESYEPYAQHPSFASFLMTFVVRTASNPLDLAGAVRKAVWAIDHDQAVIQVRTMENVISESIWRQRFCASMLGVFAAIALVLSAIGIFSVLSYSVSQRTHEIGIRAALGGTRRDILRLVAGEGLRLTLLGLAVGIVAALGLTRLLGALLYDVRPSDPLTFISVSLLLAVVAMLAVYIPARRATKVDPMVALRHE
ncbi:MAG TPA: ABC transporter permease [Terriglobia bacterium]|nr:ABC transporter permease [Terriglobia bacterium]